MSIRKGAGAGLAAVLAAWVAVSVVAHGQQAESPAAGKKEPAVKTAADTLDRRLQRQREALQRALFASDDPLPVTLIADFKAINRDRDPESTKVFPGTLVVAKANGGEDRIQVNLRTRGHSRRLSATCTFAPLRVEFPNRGLGTVFEGHKSLKLGTHCRDAELYEQYVYREYLAYRIFNQITQRSFRARLATASYMEPGSTTPFAKRAGLFLEDDDDVARRLGGETSSLQGLTFGHVDSEALALVTLFEFMIGNTDMSLAKLHNMILVRGANGTAYPVPYDFDYSGLVNARYAVPAQALNLPTVRERLYRGPCMRADQLAPYFSRLQAIRDRIFLLYDSLPQLDAGYRKDARGYLGQFFSLIEKPAEVKRAFIDGCSRSTM
ncbi:MAG: hypothetical protein JSU08_09725 [Acidobacteria bacterium]|nr:hypothetical protein [Acidobacteriota bacterium]